MNESAIRDEIVAYSRSLFERGYGCGSSGNISVRLDDGGFLLTPTNVSLGSLRAHDLTLLDAHGTHVDGLPPSKENWLHLAIYRERPDAGAVVHLHSSHAVAFSCLEGLDPRDALPPITPYAVMRCGRVALVPYFRPGDASFARLIGDLAHGHRAMLLANHGPVAFGKDLASAIASAEELEETCRLYFLLKDVPHRLLTAEQVRDLVAVFG